MKRLASIAAVAALALTGCTAEEVTNPGGQLDTGDIKSGNTVQVTADAQKVAAALDQAAGLEGAYPTTLPVAPVPLTGANTLRNYAATATGYSFCIVEPTSGAWTLWASTGGGVAGSGDSGATCAAG